MLHICEQLSHILHCGYCALDDAGIVFSPRGDYILVVMTDGQNWAKIAEIAAKIAELSR
jgi:hypothetical protein